MKNIHKITIALLVIILVAFSVNYKKFLGSMPSSAAPVPVISFSPATDFSIGTNPTSIFTNMDIGADGDLDLVVANGSTNSINIWYGDGTGNFTVNPVFTDFPVGTNPVSISVDSLNPGTDDIIDVVTANNGSDDITVLLGDNLVTFNSANYSVGTAPTSVALKDLNFDSNVDIVVANGGSDDVSVLLGDGTGAFSPATNFTVGDNPSSLVVEDFNGDSIYDLALANKDSNDVSILFGDGSGSFSVATNYSISGTSPSWITVGNLNFNSDSCFDLVTADEGSDSVSVLFGDCGGSFSPAASFPVGVGPTSVVAADFNPSTDGFNDLAVTNNDGSVSILAGDGDGNFDLTTTLTAGTSPTSIAFGDFTGDNNYDLAVTNGGSDNVSIFINTPVCPTVTFHAVGFSVNEDFPDAYEGRYYSQTVLTSGFRGSPSSSISAGSTGAYSFDDFGSAAKIYGISPAASDSFTLRVTDNWGCYEEHAYSIDTLTPPPATGLFVTPNPFTIPVGKIIPLTAVPSPPNAEGISGGVSWDSSDVGVATVDANGEVTAIAPGTATMTATVTYCTPGCFDVTGSSLITVVPLLDSIIISPDESTIYTTDPEHTGQLSSSQVPSSGAVETFSSLISDTNNPPLSIFSQSVQGTDSLWFNINLVGSSDPSGNLFDGFVPRPDLPDGAVLIPRLLFTDSAETIKDKLNNALKPEFKEKISFDVRDDLLPDTIWLIINGNTGINNNDYNLTTKTSWSSSDDLIATIIEDGDNTALSTGESVGIIDAMGNTGSGTFQVLVYNDFEQRLSTSRSAGFTLFSDSAVVNVLDHPAPSGGGSGGYIPPVRPVVPVTPSGPTICPVYLTEYIWPYKANNPAAVTLLKNFLAKYEGEQGLSPIAIYDQMTIEAVKRFQSKYSFAILSEPWDLGGPTGNVYISTLYAINRIACGLEPVPPFKSRELPKTIPVEEAIGEILASEIFAPQIIAPIAPPKIEPVREVEEVIPPKQPKSFLNSIIRFIEAMADIVNRLLGR